MTSGNSDYLKHRNILVYENECYEYIKKKHIDWVKNECSDYKETLGLRSEWAFWL